MRLQKTMFGDPRLQMEMTFFFYDIILKQLYTEYTELTLLYIVEFDFSGSLFGNKTQPGRGKHENEKSNFLKLTVG